MTAPGAPLVRAEFDATPGPARSPSRSPAAASATPTSATTTTACAPSSRCRSRSATRSPAASSPPAPAPSGWIGRAVIVPAVLPCGDCDLCRRGPGHRSAAARRCRATTSRAASPPTSSCPRAACARSTRRRLAAAGLDAGRGVRRRRRAHHALPGGPPRGRDPRRAWRSSSAPAASAATACRSPRRSARTVVAIDVDPAKLEAIAAHGAALTLDARTHDAQGAQGRGRRVRQGAGPPADRVVHLRVLGHAPPARLTAGPARPRRDAVGRRLHHGQGRGAAVEPDGLRRARDRQLGLPARVYPAALDLVLDGKVKLTPFVETHPLADINHVFDAVHHRAIRSARVLVPLKEILTA